MKTARRFESFVRFGIIALALYLVAVTVVVYTQIGRLRAAQGDLVFTIQDTGPGLRQTA